MKGFAITHLRTSATFLVVITLCTLSGVSGLALVKNSEGTSDRTGYEATQITGLPDAGENLKGQLLLSATKVLFVSPELKAEIPFTLIKSVSIGNERIETGGKVGFVARKVIPYGGGLALATITQTSVDLLTIEYLDPEGKDHGAVFFMPKLSARIFIAQLAPQLSTKVRPGITGCDGRLSSPTSVVVEPIASSGVELPAEYRVVLYEGIIRELHDKASGESYLRSGSFYTGAGCPRMTLRITVTGFSKGNQVLRAATGPIGLFVGKTSVSFHVELTAKDGHSLLSENITKSMRMDTESLGVAKSVAKAIYKKIHKLPLSPSAS